MKHSRNQVPASSSKSVEEWEMFDARDQAGDYTRVELTESRQVSELVSALNHAEKVRTLANLRLLVHIKDSPGDRVDERLPRSPETCHAIPRGKDRKAAVAG